MFRGILGITDFVKWPYSFWLRPYILGGTLDLIHISVCYTYKRTCAYTDCDEYNFSIILFCIAFWSISWGYLKVTKTFWFFTTTTLAAVYETSPNPLNAFQHARTRFCRPHGLWENAWNHTIENVVFQQNTRKSVGFLWLHK